MELQAAYGDIRAEGAQLLAISVDNLDLARRMVDHAQAEFPVLSDASTAVARAYGVYDLLGDGLAAPSVFIIDRNMTVVGGYVGQNIADRVSAESLLQFLRQR